MVTASDMSLASFLALQHSYLLAGLKCFVHDVCYKHMIILLAFSPLLILQADDSCGGGLAGNKATKRVGERLVITHSLVILKRLWNGLEWRTIVILSRMSMIERKPLAE